MIIEFQYEFCLNSSVEDGPYERANMTLSSCGVDAEVVACASTGLWKADVYEVIIMSLRCLEIYLWDKTEKAERWVFTDFISGIDSASKILHYGKSDFEYTKDSPSSNPDLLINQPCGLMCHDSIVDRHFLRVIPSKKDIPRSVEVSTKKVCIAAKV